VSNYFCLVILNGLQLSTGWTLPLFALGLLAALVLLFRLSPRRSAERLPAAAWWLAGILLLMLSAPRLLYLAEWFPGSTVMAQFDDYARIAQLASLSLARDYPLRHPSTDELLLSFYYCSLYPMAALKQLIPELTLKDCVVRGTPSWCST